MSAPWDWTLLFQTERPKLVRFLRRFGGAVSAEDVAQESFARLYALNAQTIDSPRAFLFQTARNLAIDTLRRERRIPTIDIDTTTLETPAPSPTPEDVTVEAEEARALKSALARLPENHRRALVWRKLDGLEIETVAQRLGLSVRQTQRLIVQAIALCQAHVRTEMHDRAGAKNFDGGERSE